MLTTDGITKKFGSVTAVDQLCLTAGAGEFVVLLGPSGCGKTTLLRIVAGLETPDAGTVSLSGREITHLQPKDRDVAMVFQSYALYPHMTVAENIAYPLRIRKRSGAEIASVVSGVAAKLGIDSVLLRRPKELSGGQRQRVALARAIVRQPKAFLMDEPLSNLDAQLRVEMRFELKRLQHELNTVTLYVTHDQAEAMTLGDRVAVLNHGKLIQYDKPVDVYQRPANLFVAGFVGSPAMNFIRGKIESSRFISNGVVIPLPEERLPTPGNHTDCVLGVRPEDIEVSLHGSREGSVWQRGRVSVAEHLGNETLLRLSTDSGPLTARVSSDVRASFDEAVWFKFNAGKLHFFEAQTGQAMRSADH